MITDKKDSETVRPPDVDVQHSAKGASLCTTQLIEDSVRKIMQHDCHEEKHGALPRQTPLLALPALPASPGRWHHPRATGQKRQSLGQIDLSYRETPRRLRKRRLMRTLRTTVLLAVVMYLFPLLIPMVLLLAFWIALISYFSLGPDGVAEVVGNRWYQVRRSRPRLAAQLRRDVQEAARKIDWCLDRVPSKWRDAINFPDAQARATKPFANTPDPFERLGQQGRG